MRQKVILMFVCCILFGCDDELPQDWEIDHCNGAIAGLYNFQVIERRYDLSSHQVLLDTTYKSLTTISLVGDTILFKAISEERFWFSHVDSACNFIHTSIDSSILRYKNYSAWGNHYIFTDSSYSKIEFNGIRPVVN